MDLETTTQELRTQLLHGWLGSLALHGLLLLSLLPLLRPSLLTLPKELFHWDIALVQSTPTAAEPVQNTTHTEPFVPKPTERRPMSSRTGRIVSQLAPATDQTLASAPQTAVPVAPVPQPHIAPSAAPPQEPLPTSTAENQGLSDTQASDPRFGQQADMAVSPPAAETSPTQPVIATAQETQTSPSNERSPSSAVVSNVEVPAPSRPDYGWLQQAIFRRLEELKRSSSPFLDRSHPFKVMVKAVVSRDGTLLDSSVLKSSGLDRIDEEAMALVQRAFPMQFDRTLDRQQIVMRIPITYSRE
ncbi:MAG: TonB family protein [Nitrospira sp.]|nr:TonB family protein [Nitrospira sp.]